jgi:ankyrin repeat protein
MPLSDYSNDGDNELVRSIKSKNWDHVRIILDTSPQLARKCDEYGNTPLHASVGFLAPDDVTLQLIDIYPDAVQAHGTEDWLPLHVAAMWGSSSKIIQRLIRLHPCGLDDRGSGGSKGRTPRHFAARVPENRELLERSTAEWQAIIDYDGAPNSNPQVITSQSHF